MSGRGRTSVETGDDIWIQGLGGLGLDWKGGESASPADPGFHIKGIIALRALYTRSLIMAIGTKVESCKSALTCFDPR
jgi:hypothetical protein